MDSDELLERRLKFFNTNLCAAVACCATLAITWIRYKKPDVSMTYNAALAGLVGITAGCDAVSPLGAAIMGLIFGVVIVFAVEFFDKVAKIDDPVGAISVHGMRRPRHPAHRLSHPVFPPRRGSSTAAGSISSAYRRWASARSRCMWRL
jgi:hypothetical protein